MTATLLLSMLVAPVFAAPPLPFERYGVANVNSTAIGSWIDGVQYGAETTGVDGTYLINTVAQDTSNTDYKDGGVAGDTIRYSTTDLTGSLAKFATQTDPFSVGGSTNGALTYGADVPLLKISAVVTASAYPGIAQWVRIYNPTNNPVDVTGYGIGVGTGASVAIVAGDIFSGTNPIPAIDEVYINMAGRLSTAGNAIRLFYGDNIVDRVEYGTGMAIPEETVMPNAAAPIAGNEIHRVFFADTNDCAADFAEREELLPDPYLVSIVITPNPVSVAAGAGIGVSAQGYDQYGAPVFCTPVWDVLSGGGSFAGATAGNPATATYTAGTIAGSWIDDISATEGAVVGYANLTITPGPLATITIDPTPVSVVAGGTVGLTATGEDAYGNAVATDPTWADANGGGSFVPVTGAITDYTAGMVAGSWPNSISATDGTIVGYADLTIIAGATATATGPISTWTNQANVDITYTYSGTPTSVNLYYTTNGGTTWTLAGNDVTVNGIFAYTIISGDGTYGWIASAVGGDTLDPSPPAGGTAPEAASYQYDGTNPVANAGADMNINVATLKTDATATDATSGVATTVWTFPAEVTCTDVNILNPTFGASADGVYTVTLTVTDNAGNTHLDTFQLTWSSVAGKTYNAQGTATNVRIAIVGDQATATDVVITWTDTVGTVDGYNIYRGIAADAISFAAPINAAPIAPGVQTYTDVGVISEGKSYYTIRSIVGGVGSETSTTVGRFTQTLVAGFNSLGAPLEIFPETACGNGHLLCDWTLVDQNSPHRIPNSLSLLTYNTATQGWVGRTSTAPAFLDHIEISPQQDGIMVQMSAPAQYTWVGRPAEQIRMPNYAEVPLDAPANFDLAISGADLSITWGAVAGATHYNLYRVTSRALSNYNWGAPVYSGAGLTWTDTGAATTAGAAYYIVVAVDGDGDLGITAYARGKWTRDFVAGFNAFTTPFEVFKGEVCGSGHQLCDWTLVDQNSLKRIPNSQSLLTYNTATQGWVGRTSTAPAFLDHIEIPVMGAGVMVQMSAPATYCWVS